MIDKNQIVASFKELQDNICSSLESLDGEGKFRQDLWERPGGGGGRTRIIQGQHIEKGGVNFSAVHGDLSDQMQEKLGLQTKDFFATGVSIVLHPVNPWTPIIHMNVRYFECGKNVWWFGGGIDLTPHYIIDGLAIDFHQRLKAVCDKSHPDFYPKYKEWADNYFYVRHRKETRGIGGIFFDRLDQSVLSKEALYDYVMNVGQSFVPIYTQQFSDTFQRDYSEQNKAWQLTRRGRYVEFNLVWDRGTKFGLETDGNIESILMSMPPTSTWTYRHEPGLIEKETLTKLIKGIDWTNERPSELA